MRVSSGRWKYLIVCPDRALFHSLTAVLAELTSGSSFTDIRAYPDRRALADLVEREKPHICFVDVGSNWDSALGLINELSTFAPSTLTVGISAGGDADAILRALRQGANEFLCEPFTIEQVGAALDRLRRIKVESDRLSPALGTVYGVVAGKGNCGASTVACNLAYQLQELNPQKTILLVDMDMITGTLAFQLKLKSAYSFVDALSQGVDFDREIWQSVVVKHHGLHVAIAPDLPVGAVPVQEVIAMIDYVREIYDAVVLDFASPYGEWNEQTLTLASELLLVTTNELPAVYSAQKALAHLEGIGVDRSKIRLVVNRYDPSHGVNQDAIETALKLDVFQKLAYDREAVQKSVLEGKPVDGKLANGFRSIATRLYGSTEPEHQPKGTFFKFRNFFERERSATAIPQA